jgi:hypothetical protein
MSIQICDDGITSSNGTVTIEGTGSVRVPSGTTAQRPSSPEIGMQRYNTDLEAMEMYNGTAWVRVAAAIPTLNNVSSGAILEGVASTITIAGSNFLASNLTVTFTHSGIEYEVTGITPDPGGVTADVTTPSALNALTSYGDAITIKVTNSDLLSSSTISTTVDLPAFGQYTLQSAGTYQWTCPSNVTKVSVVCVGGGGSSCHGNSGMGGGGGALAYRNSISVTPGTQYTVTVGGGGSGFSGNYTSGPYSGNSGGSTTAFSCTAGGGGGAINNSSNTGNYGPGGSRSGTYNGGGSGGNGGVDNTNSGGPGGGGAGGYSGNGGQGGSNSSGQGSNGNAGSGGGGGGGAAGSNSEGGGGGGGGVGLNGQGSNGSSGSGGGSYSAYGGGGGSGGNSGGTGGTGGWSLHPQANPGGGGNFGGGSGGPNAGSGTLPNGGTGALRIIWGKRSNGTRASFPSNATS